MLRLFPLDAIPRVPPVGISQRGPTPRETRHVSRFNWERADSRVSRFYPIRIRIRGVEMGVENGNAIIRSFKRSPILVPLSTIKLFLLLESL